MKRTLLDICDNTMLNLESLRTDIINESWVPRYFIEAMNNHISAFQLEIDRFVDTLNLVNDYYCGIVTMMPYEEPIIKDILSKLSLEDSYIVKEVGI